MFSFVQKERGKDNFLQEHAHRKSTWFGGQQSIDQKTNRSYSLFLKKWPKLSTFRWKCLQNCQKMMFFAKIFVKMTQKFKFCTKCLPDPHYIYICWLRLSARSCLQLQQVAKLKTLSI